MSTGLQPQPPDTLEQSGLTAEQIEQLLIKTMYGGEATGHALAERMRLPYSLFEPLIDRARAERLIEVKGAIGSGTAAYKYTLTDLGLDRARRFLDVNQYVGPAPVSLAVYTASIHALAAARDFVGRERLRDAFADLVIDDQLLEQVGPAVNANKAVFLYGSPGNGKTVIAEGIGRALGGEMYMPYAIHVDGHIITMFDPINHVALETSAGPASVITGGAGDRRWVRIRRPVVIVGGELTLDMLELTFNPITRFYDAPIQLKAIGGVFLVDDFGRQRMRPEELLNRWIVPLESRVDYLTLHTGKKVQVPFEVLIAFATNLSVGSLADEAFLRRIPYKIEVGDPSLDQFMRIFELNCRRRNLRFHQVMVGYLQRRHYRPARRPLRACHPRDLLEHVISLCRYRGIEPAVTRELLDAACTAYFVEDDSGAAPPPRTPVRRSTSRVGVH